MQQSYETVEEGLYWWIAPHRRPRLTCGAEGIHHLRLPRVVVGDQSELSLGMFLLYLHDVLA